MPGTHTAAALEGVELYLSAFARPSAFPKVLDVHIPSLRDIYHGGNGRIYGTVKNDGSPDYAVYRKVWLIRDRDGLCIRETWSDPTTGEYEFEHVDSTIKYTVVSYDHTRNFRAVIADNLTPEIMT